MVVPVSNQRNSFDASNQNGIKMLKRKMVMKTSRHKMNQRHRKLVFKANGLSRADMKAGISPREGRTECDARPKGRSSDRAKRKRTIVVVRRVRSKELG